LIGRSKRFLGWQGSDRIGIMLIPDRDSLFPLDRTEVSRIKDTSHNAASAGAEDSKPASPEWALLSGSS